MILSKELCGLILSGGESLRMGKDKGSLCWPAGRGKNQRQHLQDLFQQLDIPAFHSLRPGQTFSEGPSIYDELTNIGPAAGILAAHKFNPKTAWLVVACDFPFLELPTLKTLLKNRKLLRDATVFRNDEGFIEPLLAIWEISALKLFAESVAQGHLSPRWHLETQNCHILNAAPNWLRNINTLDEAKDLESTI